jgi:TRAP-type C4-dicarboxylate transport system permease small subunit
MRFSDRRFPKMPVRSEVWLRWTNRVMVYVAAVTLFGMMMLTVVDVSGRYFFNSPIRGVYELVGFTLVCTGAWGMGYSQIQKGHIRVDFLLKRFSERVQAILTILANLVGLIAFSLLFWRVILLAQYFLNLKKGNATDTLHIPIAPFVVILAVGFGVLALDLLFDLINSIVEAKRQ